MPTRLLRDWTDSATLHGVSAEAERLFIRLLMKADDFGRFHADPIPVRSNCFPLAPELRVNTITASLTELSNRGLVFCYTSGNRKYLVIPKFGKPRAVKPKFPDPPPEIQALLNSQTNVPVFGFGSVSEEREIARAQADAWIERIRTAYPRQGEQQDCRYAIRSAIDAGHQTPQQILDDVLACAVWVKQAESKGTCSFVPSAGSFFCRRQWTDPKKFEGIAINVMRAQNEHKTATPKRRDSGDLNSDDRYS